jgi:hypothetical protein
MDDRNRLDLIVQRLVLAGVISLAVIALLSIFDDELFGLEQQDDIVLELPK